MNTQYVKEINGYMIKDEEARENIEELTNDVDNLKNGSLKLHSLAKSSATNIIQFPNGKNMFIDTGVNNQWNDIQSAIASLGITKFDYAVITHFHPDHYGNIQNFINTYDLSNCVWYIGMKPDYTNHSNDLNDPENLYDNQVNILTSAGFTPIVPENDSYIDICEDVKLHFLNTSAQISENYYGRQNEYDTDGKIGFNDFSLITEIIHKDVRILSTGDIEAPVEEQYTSYLGKVNIMLMPHHGVNEDCYKPFYTATRPDYAISNYYSDNTTPYGVQHKGFMLLKNQGSYIITALWSKGENNIFTFISNGKQVFSNVKNGGLGSEQTNTSLDEGRLYRLIDQLINFTSTSLRETITLNELIQNMNLGSKLSFIWIQEYNTRYPQLYSDLMSIFSKFYYNMIVDIERLNGGQTRIKVHNLDYNFIATRQGDNSSWVVKGSGYTPSLTESNLLSYINTLPIGIYTCKYFTASSNTDMGTQTYVLQINIFENATNFRATLQATARTTTTSSIAVARYLVGYIQNDEYILKKVI